MSVVSKTKEDENMNMQMRFKVMIKVDKKKKTTTVISTPFSDELDEREKKENSRSSCGLKLSS